MIGIFDSGAGGLSVYREIFRILPKEKYIYFSDNAHCPYGEKTQEYIIDRARKITDYLIGEGCDVVVVACNTATAAAIATLRAEYAIPFIGMEPAVKPAALSTQSGVIGVLATAGTLKASKYLDTRDKYSGGVKVIEHVGQGFVELVESGKLTGEEAEKTVSESVMPLINAGADTIVLGCTHYPFLKETVEKVAGKGVTVIDPAPAAAKHLLDVMTAKGLIRNDAKAKVLVSNGNPATVVSPKDATTNAASPKDASTSAISPKNADIQLKASGDLTSLLRIFNLL